MTFGLLDSNDFLDLWRGKIQFHILVNVDSNAWKFFICISSNSNFTKRQHSSTLLFSQVLSHKFFEAEGCIYFYSALFFCGAVFGSNHALQYLSYPSQVSLFRRIGEQYIMNRVANPLVETTKFSVLVDDH